MKSLLTKGWLRSGSASRCGVFSSHTLDGWRGYPEVSFPTLFLNGGFKLLDLGGDGEFTLPGHGNRSYTTHSSGSGNLGILGATRYRPSRARAGMRKDKIYHPLKPKAMIEPPTARLKIVGRWALELIRDIV